MRIKAVESHTQSGKHREYVCARQKTPIGRFCSTLSTANKDVALDVMVQKYTANNDIITWPPNYLIAFVASHFADLDY